MIATEKSRIFGNGPEYSPLMIISDYPTKEDLEKGKILTGATGNMVSDFLKQHKYSIDKCYRTAYIKCAMPGFRAKNKKESREALEAAKLCGDWDDILINEIKAIQPNVILAFGELPLRFLTNEKNINRFRGSILPLNPQVRSQIGLEKHIRVVNTFHPRDIFPNPLASVYVTLDYAKALRFLASGIREFEEPGNIWIARNPEALIEYWKRAQYGEFLVTDIETRYNWPICASLCSDGNEAVSFPLISKDMNAMQMMCIWRKYDEILRSRIPKINQNMVYDWTVLERVGFEIKNIAGDTMLMAHTLYPELPKGLDFLTSIYTDITYYKDEGKEFDPKLHDFDRLLTYNARDSLATWKVWKAQQQDAEDLKVKNFYFNFVHKCFYHYKKINDRGILVDDLRRFQLLDKYYNLLNNHNDQLNQIYGQKLNVRSPQQIGKFVYEYLNCPLHTHLTPNGNKTYSTDEDTLTNMWLNEVYTDEVICKILQEIIICRKLANAINLLETPFHSDNRMRTSYNLGGTTTGRTSTSQAIGWFLRLEGREVKSCQFGTAFQKISKHAFKFEGIQYLEDIDKDFIKEIRQIYVPTPGFEFFGFDGSNAEGRVVCVLSEDWETLEFIESGNDLHRLTASWIYEKPIQYIKKPSKERDIGKMARHAGNLGQTGAGLSIQIYRSTKFANEVMRKFHINAPKVQGVFHYQIEKYVENNRVLINPFGRRRDFFSYDKRNKKDTLKEALSYIPQGTVSDHFKLISLDIAEKAEWAYQLAEMHDGLLYEIPNGYREKFANIVSETTSRKIDFTNCTLSRNHQLQIPVEMEYSTSNWYDMQEFPSKNER